MARVYNIDNPLLLTWRRFLLLLAYLPAGSAFWQKIGTEDDAPPSPFDLIEAAKRGGAPNYGGPRHQRKMSVEDLQREFSDRG